MKAIFFTLIFLPLLGCDNQFSQDSTSGVPSCDTQFDRYSACFNTQVDSWSCGISSREGEALGERAGAYCGNLHFAPDFRLKCEQALLNRMPDFAKEMLKKRIDRCT